MTDQLARLLALAREKYGKVTMCASAMDWEDCVSHIEGDAILWFNDSTGSTHTVKEPHGAEGSEG